MHLTGRYPPWWDGLRFHKPIICICGSESSDLTRDGIQRILVGPPTEEAAWGTGFIPSDAVLEYNRKMGAPNCLDSINVRHNAGGASVVMFKSYEQGRGKWQASTVDLVWFDEEPPMDIYSEGRTRTMATGGSVIITSTLLPTLAFRSIIMA